MKRVTLKDVAKRSGVSIQTVSRVINNLPYVSEETRKKVFQAIEELNYRPSVEGKKLVSLKNSLKSRTNNIGCILFPTYNKYSEPFFSEILEEIDCCLREFNLHHYFTCTLDDLQEQSFYYRIINPEMVDGIVLIGIGDKYYQEVKKIRKNIDNLVILADYLSDGSISSIYPYGLDAGYQIIKYLFTAIFVVSDPMAIGVYKAIQKNGLKIPDDISVIGYDGIRLGEHLWPPLTTIGINKKEMVKEAIKVLIEEIEGKRKTPIRVVFPVYLIERKSCRKI